MKATNAELDQMLASLEPALKTKGKLGYAAARNKRVITEALTEYFAARDQLVMELGEPVLDDADNETGRYELKFSSSNFKIFETAIGEYAEIEHKVKIMKVASSYAMDELTGEEIYNLSWMIEEVGDGASSASD